MYLSLLLRRSYIKNTAFRSNWVALNFLLWQDCLFISWLVYWIQQDYDWWLMELSTMICQSFLKALILFQLSNNCSFQRYSKLLFPSLVGHTVNYTVPPHLWVNHTVRNVGLPYLALYFLVGPPPSSLCNHRFRVYQNPANFKRLH